MSEFNSIESAKEAYYQGNKDVILIRVRDYYKMIKQDKESKQEINTETYLKKKKRKKREYGKKQISYMSEEKKQKEYQKNYHEAKKSQYNNQ